MEEIKEQLTHEKLEKLVVTNDAPVVTEESDKDVIAEHELEEMVTNH